MTIVLVEYEYWIHKSLLYKKSMMSIKSTFCWFSKAFFLICFFTYPYLQRSLRFGRHVQHNNLYGRFVFPAAVLCLQHVRSAVLARRDHYRELRPVVFYIHGEVIAGGQTLFVVEPRGRVNRSSLSVTYLCCVLTIYVSPINRWHLTFI